MGNSRIHKANAERPHVVTNMAKKASASSKKVEKSVVPKAKPEKVKRYNKDGKERKRTVGRLDNFSTHIFRVLKQVHPDTGITSKSMSVINSFCCDIFDRLILPGELAKHTATTKE